MRRWLRQQFCWHDEMRELFKWNDNGTKHVYVRECLRCGKVWQPGHCGDVTCTDDHC